MTPAFADTSYFLALLIATDVNHSAAQKWTQSNRIPLVTSEYVVAEIGNHLSPIPTRRLFGHFLRVLSSDPRMTVIAASSKLLTQGAHLYSARSDKAWSLTDCISIVIMMQKGLQDALTADHHFEQAGFTILL